VKIPAAVFILLKKEKPMNCTPAPVITVEKHSIFAHYEHYTTSQEAAILEREAPEKDIAAMFGRTVKAIQIKRYNMLYPRRRYDKRYTYNTTNPEIIKATSVTIEAPRKVRKNFISEEDLQAQMEAGEN
jgi:hypothetical protein